MENIYASYTKNHLGKDIAAPVTEADVEKQLEGMLREHVRMEPKDGAAEKGDIANIDFEGFLEGVPFEGGKGEHYDLELGSGSFIPGFEDQLVGHIAGEDVDVNVTFPEHYQAENLAGKAVVFKCHIHQVKAKHQHELNDEFASHFGLASLAELRDAVRNNIARQRQSEIDHAYLEKLLRHIVTASTIEVSPEDAEVAKKKILDYYTKSVAQYGMTIDSYLQAIGMDKTKFDLSLTEEAYNTVRTDIVTDYIARRENLHPSEAEINHEIEAIRNAYHLDDAKVNDLVTNQRAELVLDITREKVADFLLANND